MKVSVLNNIKALSVATATALFSGCVNEEFSENKGGEGNGQDGTFTIKAYIDNAPATRTSLGDLKEDRYPVLSSEGDSVCVMYPQSNYKETFSLISGAGTDSAMFKGKYFDNEYNVSVHPPANATASVKTTPAETIDGKRYFSRLVTVGASLTKKQPYKEGTFAKGVFPMIGFSADNYVFRYDNVCGMLQIPVVGTGKISKVIFYGNDGEPVAGKFSEQYKVLIESGSSRNITYSPVPPSDSEDLSFINRAMTVTDTARVIYIDCGEGIQLDPDNATTFNIAVFPQTFKNGFSVRFLDESNGGSFEKTTSQPVTIKRSYVKRMKAVEYTTPEPLEPANCFAIDAAGYYLMPAYCMGNRPISARLDVDENGNYSATGNPVSAAWLWTDTPGAVSDVEYIKGKDGYISFRANKDASGYPMKGNTVVALYDTVTKEILWSWHIWMSDFKEVVTNGTCAGGTTEDGFVSQESKGRLVIMDRNLGAISADKEDGWETYGLYYQPGRKDPFIGAKGAGGTVNVMFENKSHQDPAVSTYYSYEDSPFGEYTSATRWNEDLSSGWNYKKEYVIAEYASHNPMCFASSWTKKGDVRWTTKELNATEPFVSKGGHEDFWNRTKTINDPCPAGWTILGERGGELFSLKSSKTIKVTEPTSYSSNGMFGMEVKFVSEGTTYDTWWPAAGFRSVDGRLGNLGYGGYYWHYDHIKANHGGHGLSFSLNSKRGGYSIGSNGGPIGNHACSVRCVKALQSSE